MASLLIKTDGFGGRVCELKLGMNRFGRSPTNDFQIEHPTVSGVHCELLLRDGAVTVRDCDSTNGTFLDDEPVHEQAAYAGQVLRLGEVELLVETTDIRVAIPTFELPKPPDLPVVSAEGALLCPRHPQVPATYRCTHCLEFLCDECVTRMRRRGGRTLKLCPLCSFEVERIGPQKKKRRSFMQILRQTVKLPFARNSRREEVDP